MISVFGGIFDFFEIKRFQILIAIVVEDKVTEYFCIVADICEVFDIHTEKCDIKAIYQIFSKKILSSWASCAEFAKWASPVSLMSLCMSRPHCLLGERELAVPYVG